MDVTNNRYDTILADMCQDDKLCYNGPVLDDSITLIGGWLKTRAPGPSESGRCAVWIVRCVFGGCVHWG